MFASRQHLMVFIRRVFRQPPKLSTYIFKRYENCSGNKFHGNGKKSYNYYSISLVTVPPFLTFFEKKEKEEPKPFWEQFVPDIILHMIRKRPEESESPEDQLINLIKRTLFCIHEGEYVRAEQMAHLALRMAQDLQHYDGITLCYDVMANQADHLKQYKKAEKLYIEVIQRLLWQGVPQGDNRILHLSIKLAYLAEQQENYDDAITSYVWALSRIDRSIQERPDDDDLAELSGLGNSYYGHFLLNRGNFAEAKTRLQIAYDTFVRFKGKLNRDFVNIANDLAVSFSEVNDLESADKYANEALSSAALYPDLIDSGIYQANHGLILLKKGLITQATRVCQEAKELAGKQKNISGKEQAVYCLQQIEKVLEEEKKAKEQKNKE